MMLTFTSYIFIENPHITIKLYLISAAFVALYSILKKELNMLHISAFVISLCTIEYITIGFFDNFLKSSFSDKLTVAILYYTYQILFNIIGFFVFIFRVQISRVLSRSKEIKLTPFDNIIHWVFIYKFIVISLHTIDYYINSKYNISTLSFFYTFYEELIYFGMATIITILVCMAIYYEKEKINNESKEV